MAWLQNLAGHAENLLNKIDQNAATVLSEKSSKSDEIININSNEEKESSHPMQGIKSVSALKLSTIKSSPSLSPKKGQSLLATSKSAVNLDEGIIFSTASSSAAAPEKADGDEHEHTVKCDNLSVSTKSSSLQQSVIEEVQQHLEKISKLEFENNDLNKQLLNYQHLYSEIFNENVNLRNNMERSNELVAEAQKEMEVYKARAYRVLQEKEKMLSVKSGDDSEEIDGNIYNLYQEELKKELEFQQQQNEQLTEKLNANTKEVMSLQQQFMVMQHSLQQANQQLETHLVKERTNRASYEDECRKQAQELLHLNNDITKLQNELIKKNQEIEKLKLSIKQKSTSLLSEDIEVRLQNLTQTLMLKQNNLETVTCERNALKIQLEKLENEYHKNLSQMQRAQEQVINVNDTDDVKSQVPHFMRVSPLDAGVTKRVKHAYSTLDGLSVRTGIFLRRYPLARVFVFCYMILLHIWVFLILFMYAPR